MTATSIEWTDEVWNPTTGCTKVSPGCDHCYAERITERFHGPGSFERVIPHYQRLEAPLHWRKPRRVFVNSMSDLFHADVPMGFLEEVWRVMECCPQHTFQVLTKRAERMERLVPRLASFEDGSPLGRHIWLGVSVESPAYYSRIRHLQRTPAALRFLSCEPLLGPLDDLPLEGIGWVIVGGESGPGARPMHPAWVRGVRDQCIAAGVPFFFKQWGEWAPIGPVYPADGEDEALDEFGWEVGWSVAEWEEVGREVRWQTTQPRDVGVDSHIEVQPSGPDPWWMVRRGKKSAGRRLDGRTWDGYPETRDLALVAS